MNAMVPVVTWLAVQVTAVLIPAAIWHLIASRRGPAAGASIAAAALALTLAVTACAPWIGGPAIRPAAAREAANRELLEARADLPPEMQGRLDQAAGLGVSWERMAAALRTFEHRVGEASAPHAGAMRAATWGLLALSAVGLARLAIGLMEVRRCRRRGVVVRDRGLRDELDSLRSAMGLIETVEVRELPGALSAATAGWRRPVILLPAGWRDWPEGDLRAVLAHELAHIRRSDYVLGLIAGLTQAIHAYHPLVAWLGSRLRMAQEQAADAIAAEVSGGKQVYRAVLARMALEQDVRASWWPVRPFSPARGTLIRRITMLETKDHAFDRSASRSRRWLTGGLLCAVALAVVLVPNPLRGSPPAHPVTKADAKDLPAFDLSYIPADAMGVYAMRPAQILQREGMDVRGRELIKLIAENQAKLGEGFVRYWSEHPLKPEQIEQVVAAIRFGRTRQQGKELRSFDLEGFMVRTTAPYDWNRLVRAVWPGATELHCDGKAYLKVKSSYLGGDACFLVADERTLVQAPEAEVLTLIRRREPVVPTWTKSDQWKEIERGLMAVVIDNSEDRIRTATKREETLDRDDSFAQAFRLIDRVFFTLDPADDVSFRILVTPHVLQDTDKLFDMFVGSQDLAVKSCMNYDGPEDLAPEALRIRGLYAAVLKSTTAAREPFGLRLANRWTIPAAAVKFAEFIPLLIMESL